MAFRSDQLRLVLGAGLEDLHLPGAAGQRLVSCITLLEEPNEAAGCRPGELAVLVPTTKGAPDVPTIMRELIAGGAVGLVAPASLLSAAWSQLTRCFSGHDLAVGLLADAMRPRVAANILSRALAEPQASSDLSVLRSAESLQNLVEALARLVGNSVTIEALDSELLAFSAVDGVIDRAREDTILHRHGFEPAVRWIKRQGYWSSICGSPQPVRVPPVPELDFAGRVSMRVGIDDDPLAMIWVADTARPLDEADLGIIKEAAATAAHILLRQQAAQRHETELRVGLLEDVVHGRITSPENLRAVAQSLGWPIERFQQALVVTIDQFEAFVVRHAGRSSRRIQALRDRLAQAVRFEAQTVDPEAIVGPLSVGVVVLFGTQQPDPGERKAAAIRQADRIVRRVSAAIPGMTVTVGVGGDFDSFEQVAECFRQAQLAARLGASLWGGNRVVHYDDLGIHRVLYAMREDEGAITPALQRIIDHDRERGTDFVQTLATYLDARCRLRAAAERLHVHRNTLQYRLRRIEDLAGVSLNDRDNRVALELGLMMLEMKRSIESVPLP